MHELELVLWGGLVLLHLANVFIGFLRPASCGVCSPKSLLVTHDNLTNRTDQGELPLGRCIIRISALSTLMVGSRPTMVVTGDGRSAFDSGEGA